MADAFQTTLNPFNLFGANSSRPTLDTTAPYQIPDYLSLTDPSTGQLQSQYSLAMDPNIATDNPWAQMMTQTAKNQTAQQMDAATRQASSGTANAWGQLAARGGLSSGAKERVATQGANNLMTQKQAVQSQGAQNQLGVLEQATDKQNNINEVNLQTLLANNQGQNQYNANKYNTQMQTWAAGQQATATEHSGKKG